MTPAGGGFGKADPAQTHRVGDFGHLGRTRSVPGPPKRSHTGGFWTEASLGTGVTGHMGVHASRPHSRAPNNGRAIWSIPNYQVQLARIIFAHAVRLYPHSQPTFRRSPAEGPPLRLTVRSQGTNGTRGFWTTMGLCRCGDLVAMWYAIGLANKRLGFWTAAFPLAARLLRPAWRPCGLCPVAYGLWHWSPPGQRTNRLSPSLS